MLINQRVTREINLFSVLLVLQALETETPGRAGTILTRAYTLRNIAEMLIFYIGTRFY